MFKIILLFIMFISSALFAKDKFYVCAIFHNEARFLDEWVTFHLKQGADKIYMYNHQSTDEYQKVLYKYVITGKVILENWDYSYSCVQEWNTIQCNAYKDCLKKVYGKVRWIAFIDTDEFLFSPLHIRVREILDSYEDCDQIGVNWVMYGTSGIKRLKDGDWLTRNMVMREELYNPHVKSIVRPDKVVDCINPHFCVMTRFSKTVNENKEQMSGPFSTHSSNILRINHYWSRDRDFMCNEKLKRQSQWGARNLEEIQEMEHQMNQIYDPILSQ